MTTLDAWGSHLCLPSAGVIGPNHHAQCKQKICLYKNNFLNDASVVGSGNSSARCQSRPVLEQKEVLSSVLLQEGQSYETVLKEGHRSLHRVKENSEVRVWGKIFEVNFEKSRVWDSLRNTVELLCTAEDLSATAGHGLMLSVSVFPSLSGSALAWSFAVHIWGCCFVRCAW